MNQDMIKTILIKHRCVACDSTESHKDIRSSGIYENWYGHDGCHMCNRCFAQYVGNPSRDKSKFRKWNSITNKKRMWFKGKRIVVKRNPRKGKCLYCGKEGYTHMHHIEYIDDNPLEHTIELCPSCHAYQTWNDLD